MIHNYERNQQKLVAARSDMNVEIDIDVRKGSTIREVSPVLGKIFSGTEPLAALVPSYWHPYLESKTGSLGCNTATQMSGIGGKITGARIIKQIPPTSAEVAKNFLLEGVVVLEAIITEKGDIGDLVIVKPAGAGFDEAAVETVSQWKY